MGVKMGRQLKEKNLKDREARKKLPTRSEPHWRLLESGLHLGYRKAPKGGAWVGRRFTEARQYKEVRLGIADDMQNADGKTALSFDQAQKAAREWFEAEKRKDVGVDEVFEGHYAVADAIKDYLAHYKVEGKGISVAVAITNAHILPALGEVRLDRLTTKRLNDWLQKLASSPARLRTAKTSKKFNVREQTDDADATRRRRATANRVLTVLKAALNYAWREGKIPSDTAWRKVKPFRNVSAPVIRYLSEDEYIRLVNATAPVFRPMVQAALFTGCRYGELTRLVVADFNDEAANINIRTSKSGKPRHVVLTDEGKKFFEQAVINKSSADLIFTHDGGAAWGKSHQHRPLAEACKNAKIKPAISFHVLRHSYGSRLAMKGVPMAVIATQLGHCDTRMTEKHYAHLSPSYVADTVRAALGDMGIAPQGNVEQLKQKKN